MVGLECGQAWGAPVKVKAFLTTRDIAIALGEYLKDGRPNTRKVRRQLEKMGVLMRRVGFSRDFQVATQNIQELDPNAYERVMADSRCWDEGCSHPPADIKPEAVARWCSGCGAIHYGEGWVHPRAMEDFQ